MAGAGFNARLWRLGTFGAEGLASRTADKAQGYAATGVYSFLSNWFSAELRATWIGPKFQNLFLSPADRGQVNADASVSFSLGRFGSLNTGWTLGGNPFARHACEGRHPAICQPGLSWTPTFAGVTDGG